MPNLMLEHGIDKHYHTGSRRFAKQNNLCVDDNLVFGWIVANQVYLLNIELKSKIGDKGYIMITVKEILKDKA